MFEFMGSVLATIILRARLVWAILLGRNLALHRNILERKPVAYFVVVDGSLIVGEHGLAVNCVVKNNGMTIGIQMGPHSTAIGCSVTGSSGFGFDGGPPEPPDEFTVYEDGKPVGTLKVLDKSLTVIPELETFPIED